MSIKLSLAAVTLALAAAAEQANAASVYLTGVSPNASMTVTFPGMSAQTTPYVGQINWSFNRSDPANAALAALLPGSTFGTFCIEGTQDVYINATANFANVFTDISLAPQDNLGSHFEMGAKSAALNRFWDDYYAQAATSNANGAAFQLGIWELLYDTTPDLSAGSFQAAATSDNDSGKAFEQAQIWLANYTTVIPTTHYELYALSDPCLQDQLFGVPTAGPGNAQPVPLPAALPAGLALMGAVGAARKFRKRRA